MLKTFRAYHLAVQFYRLARALPVRGPLRNQLDRAASSIALNLAEGSGKSSRRDQLRFYEIALGSIRETEAIFDLIAPTAPETVALLDLLARHTFNLCRSLRTK